VRFFLRSKIHRAVVTGANPDYRGSISIDADLMEKSGVGEFERVCVWNVISGERIETYAMGAAPCSGEICLNGAAAKKFWVGDIVIIAAFELADKAPKPKIILVDKNNRFAEYL
jgi:aspartate 1-decarboxylase